MNVDEGALLEQMVEVIVREADPESIILFGSRARGEAGPESDVDLLVVEREPFGPGRSRIREANRLYMALRHVPVATGGSCMADLEHGRSLLRLAQRDLNAVIAMQELAVVADEIVGFHAQQAVEKALKAWLSAAGLVYPLTHPLARLFTLLESAGADVESFWALARFTPYAVQARYEEGPPEADEALDRPAVPSSCRARMGCRCNAACLPRSTRAT